MVYTDYNIAEEFSADMRKIFVDSVIEIFGTADNFLDAIENENYTIMFDFLSKDDECYIIDTERGEYINWYKFTHIGRCIHIATDLLIDDENDVRDFIIRFLLRFKGE